MKKIFSVLTIITLCAVLLLPNFGYAASLDGTKLLASFDGDNIPTTSTGFWTVRNGNIGSHTYTITQRAGGDERLAGKAHDDTFMEVLIDSSNNSAWGSFFWYNFAKGSAERNYINANGGYLVCEMDIYSPNVPFYGVALTTNFGSGSGEPIGTRFDKNTKKISADEWHHIAYVIDWNAGTSQVYLDGAAYGAEYDATALWSVSELRLYVVCDTGSYTDNSHGLYYADNVKYYMTDRNSYKNAGSVSLYENFSDKSLSSAFSLLNAPDQKYTVYSGGNSSLSNGVGSCYGEIGGKAADDYALKLNYNTADVNVASEWANATNPDFVGTYTAEYDIYLVTDAEKLGRLSLRTNGGAFISGTELNGAALYALGADNPWREGEWNHVAFVIECKAGGNKSTVKTYINGVLAESVSDSEGLNGSRSDIRLAVNTTEAAEEISKAEWSEMSVDEKKEYAGVDSAMVASGDNWRFYNPLVFYIDNIAAYENGKMLYDWKGNGLPGDTALNSVQNINIQLCDAVGGKSLGDFSAHISDAAGNGTPYFEYLWGSAEKGCADETEANAKWSESGFTGNIVVNAGVQNNGKFSGYRLCTGDGQPVSNTIPATALKSGWNSLTVVIECTNSDGSIVRTAREYVNGIELIPDIDETVMLGSFDSTDGYCRNELCLVFDGEEEENELNIYVDDISVSETISAPIIGKGIISNAAGAFADSSNGILYLTDMTGKTTVDAAGLFADNCLVRIYSDSAINNALKSGDNISEGQIIVAEDSDGKCTTYTLKTMPADTIIVSGEQNKNSIGGSVSIGAYPSTGGVLVAAQYDAADNSMKIIDFKDISDEAGLLTMNFEPAKNNGDKVKIFLMDSLNTIKPICENKELTLIR